MGQEENRIAQEAEESVRAWLDDQGEKYKYTQQFRVSGYCFDFFVVEPRPMVIEVFHCSIFSSANPFRMKAKRLLTSRVLLAERFGPDFPVIAVVVGDQYEDQQVPFADETFHFKDISKKINKYWPYFEVKTELRELFSKHEAFEPKLTSGDQVQEVWKESLTMSELLDHSLEVESNFAGDLAQALSKECSEFANSGEPFNRLRKKMPDLEYWQIFLRSPRSSQLIQDQVSLYMNRLFQAEVSRRKISFESGGMTTNLNYDVFQLPEGGEFLVKRLFSSKGLLSHKANELFADSILLNTCPELPSARRLLLLSMNEEPLLKPKGKRDGIGGRAISGKAGEFSLSPSDISAINRLESAGWRVFPWDFRDEEPRFIHHIRKVLDS